MKIPQTFRRTFLWLRIVALVFCFCCVVQDAVGEPPRGAPAAVVDEVDESQQLELIRKLIDDLDAEKFAPRQRAERRLIEIGVPALDLLKAALPDGSVETRYRASRAVNTIEFADLSREFEKLSSRPDTEMSVEAGMWLIARVMNFKYSRESMDKEFDAIAKRVRAKLGKGVDPKSVEPAKLVDAICSVLGDMGFKGNYADYANPKNSSIEHVLATQKGLPILLSHVMVGVADRLKVPIVGVAIPGRYMVKYDGSRAPDGFEKKDIVVDPFGEWAIVDEEWLRQRILRFDPKDLRPNTNRAAILRMMVNLIVHYERAGDDTKAGQVNKYARLFGPTQ